MKVIAWLEFELAYLKAAVQHIWHYSMETYINKICKLTTFAQLSFFLSKYLIYLKNATLQFILLWEDFNSI